MSYNIHPRLLPALLALGLAATASAGDPPPADKSGYHLFHPVPTQLMREMSTDRPDKTEGPFTVDAGHVQLEMDFATFTHDRTDGVRTRTWSVAPFNVRLGLLNNVDLNLIFDSYVRISEKDSASKRIRSGVGDLTTRLKINFWGNDGGPTAFGTILFVKTPTNTAGLGNRSVEGGIIFPLNIDLPGGWGLGLMTEFDFLRDAVGRKYHTDFVNTITLGHAIVGDLSGYVEFFSSVSTEDDSDWVGTVDLGLTYAVTANLQLDAGCNLGVTRAADDVNPFVGVSIRF